MFQIAKTEYLSTDKLIDLLLKNSEEINVENPINYPQEDCTVEFKNNKNIISIEMHEKGTTNKDNIYRVQYVKKIDEQAKIERLLVITDVSQEIYENYSIDDVLSNNEGHYQELVMIMLNDSYYDTSVYSPVVPEGMIIWDKVNGLREKSL